MNGPWIEGEGRGGGLAFTVGEVLISLSNQGGLMSFGRVQNSPRSTPLPEIGMIQHDHLLWGRREDDKIIRPLPPQTETCGGGGVGTHESDTDQVLRRGRKWRNVAGIILKRLCH